MGEKKLVLLSCFLLTAILLLFTPSVLGAEVEEEEKNALNQLLQEKLLKKKKTTTLSPSLSPTLKPTTTLTPTLDPTSLSPTTLSPTKPPSFLPSLSPTRKPTSKPITLAPTSKPFSLAPTLQPTIANFQVLTSFHSYDICSGCTKDFFNGKYLDSNTGYECQISSDRPVQFQYRTFNSLLDCENECLNDGLCTFVSFFSQNCLLFFGGSCQATNYFYYISSAPATTAQNLKATAAPSISKFQLQTFSNLAYVNVVCKGCSKDFTYGKFLDETGTACTVDATRQGSFSSPGTMNQFLCENACSADSKCAFYMFIDGAAQSCSLFYSSTCTPASYFARYDASKIYKNLLYFNFNFG